MTQREWADQLVEHLRSHAPGIRQVDLAEWVHADLMRSAVHAGQFAENLTRRFVMEAHERGLVPLSITPVHYRHWRRPGGAPADAVSFPLGGYTMDVPTGLESRDQVQVRLEGLAVPLHHRALPEEV